MQAGAVSALVDASGFAFGDQWGPGPSRQMGRLFGSYARAGKPVVLLPQAFGPFQEPEVAEAARMRWTTPISSSPGTQTRSPTSPDSDSASQ